jgi:hypothetical protein
MRFRDWLINSNEAKPIRDAMALNDQMPPDFGMKSRCFNVLQDVAETAWEKTKKDLGL